MTSVISLDMEDHVVLKHILKWWNKLLQGKPVPQYLSGKDDKSN